jgi:hypothetical protein
MVIWENRLPIVWSESWVLGYSWNVVGIASANIYVRTAKFCALLIGIDILHCANHLALWQGRSIERPY